MDLPLPYHSNLTLTHKCESEIGYTFREPMLLWEALQAPGAYVTFCQVPRYREAHKRLAIVGDKVLDFLLSLKWYPTWQTTAQFDHMRSTVFTNEHFYTVGENHRLQDYVEKDPGTLRVQKRTMSTVVEAIIGAAYLDGGMEAAKTVAKNLDIDVLEDTPPDSSHDVLADPLQKLDLDASKETSQAGSDKTKLT
ncbi:MAG: hypothetical protein Q9212_004300 [Teloschistes hypoglaucus]